MENIQRICECNALESNKMYHIPIPDMGGWMSETKYHTRQKNFKGMKIVLKFPEKSAGDDSLKKEIRLIMQSTLQEQMKSATS